MEPHPTLRTVLVQRLRQDGHLTAAVGRVSEALEVCQEQSPDLLVSAELLEHSSALRLAEQLRVETAAAERADVVRMRRGIKRWAQHAARRAFAACSSLARSSICVTNARV